MQKTGEMDGAPSTAGDEGVGPANSLSECQSALLFATCFRKGGASGRAGGLT